MDQKTPSQTGREIELLSFKVNDQEYSLDIMSVREIRGWSKATPLPHSPPYMQGVINLRGSVLPIVDLSIRFGLAEREVSPRDVIIVVNVDDQTVGLLVDAVVDILSINTDAIDPPPEMGDNTTRFVDGLIIQNDRMIRLLSLKAAVPAKETNVA